MFILRITLLSCTNLNTTQSYNTTMEDRTRTFRTILWFSMAKFIRKLSPIRTCVTFSNIVCTFFFFLCTVWIGTFYTCRHYYYYYYLIIVKTERPIRTRTPRHLCVEIPETRMSCRNNDVHVQLFYAISDRLLLFFFFRTGKIYILSSRTCINNYNNRRWDVDVKCERKQTWSTESAE